MVVWRDSFSILVKRAVFWSSGPGRWAAVEGTGGEVVKRASMEFLMSKPCCISSSRCLLENAAGSQVTHMCVFCCYQRNKREK